MIPHSFQPSFFSETSHFPRVFGGFLERRIPGKDGEVTPGEMDVSPNWGAANFDLFPFGSPKRNRPEKGALQTRHAQVGRAGETCLFGNGPTSSAKCGNCSGMVGPNQLLHKPLAPPPSRKVGIQVCAFHSCWSRIVVSQREHKTVW